MIRLLNKKDDKKVFDYLWPEKEFNLFIIGDIENYGYNQSFMKLWGQFDKDNSLKAVMMKYYNTIIFYSKDNFNTQKFIKIIKDTKATHLIGKADVIDKFMPHFKIKDKDFKYFCKLGINNFIALPQKHKVYTIDSDDDVENIVDNIMKLYDCIEEFEGHMSRDLIYKNFIEGSGRPFYIKNQKGEIVSMAQTTAENSVSAMVISVGTHPDYRGRGYCTSCLRALCKKLTEEDRTLCLFYDNPKAGRIYKKLGFYDIGNWSIYKIM